MNLFSLHVFPVKSMRGSALDRASVDKRGLAGDRRWMVVDERQRFVTRREVPALAQLHATQTDDGVALHHPNAGSLHCAFPEQPVSVQVWRDTVPARMAGPEVSEYLFRALGRTVQLVYQADSDTRLIDRNFAGPNDIVSFTDGFPILVTTEESLAALNDRLAQPIPMARFRPNIVVAGADGPWVEQSWRRIRVGDVILRLVKPCTRCVVTTQDHLTGERGNGNEPLLTLRALDQRTPAGIVFGQNAIPETLGEISVGDPVEILDA